MVPLPPLNFSSNPISGARSSNSSTVIVEPGPINFANRRGGSGLVSTSGEPITTSQAGVGLLGGIAVVLLIVAAMKKR